MIAFRCGRCGDSIKVDDIHAGKVATCPRCQKVNVCPEPTSPSPTTAQIAAAGVRSDASQSPLASPRVVAPPQQHSAVLMWIAVAIFMLVAGAWGIRAAYGAWSANATTASTASPADQLQQELLRKNVGQPGDPRLNEMYQELNAKHFAGTLPAMQVLWEPRLADVGRLAAERFTLEGMFGHVGRKSVILLNPELQADPKALARALSHEIVHAHLFSIGDTTSDHGPAFQSVLRRLSFEGAFEGIVSTDDDRERLRAWIDEESKRLDAERAEFDKTAPDIERERVEVERALADLNARTAAANASGQGWPSPGEVQAVTAQRDAYNQRAINANERAERDRADIENFNREVARYNLMLVYPDGLDASAVLKPKAIK